MSGEKHFQTCLIPAPAHSTTQWHLWANPINAPYPVMLLSGFRHCYEMARSARLYAVLCGSCVEGLSVIATNMEQDQQETSQQRLATCMASARKVTPFVTKACRLKALIRQAFSNYVSHATASRPSPSGGLRPALTRLHGNITNIDHTRQPLSTSTRNDEGPKLLEIEYRVKYYT